jgi:hypothetical protein
MQFVYIEFGTNILLYYVFLCITLAHRCIDGTLYRLLFRSFLICILPELLSENLGKVK